MKTRLHDTFFLTIIILMYVIYCQEYRRRFATLTGESWIRIVSRTHTHIRQNDIRLEKLYIVNNTADIMIISFFIFNILAYIN